MEQCLFWIQEILKSKFLFDQASCCKHVYNLTKLKVNIMNWCKHWHFLRRPNRISSHWGVSRHLHGIFIKADDLHRFASSLGKSLMKLFRKASLKKWNTENLDEMRFWITLSPLTFAYSLIDVLIWFCWVTVSLHFVITNLNADKSISLCVL